MRAYSQRRVPGRVKDPVDLGAEIGVNPNTVMRSYERLTNDGIIFNKRGIGYFICEEAREKVLEKMRADFMQNELPGILKKIRLLGLSPDVLAGSFDENTVD